MHGARIRAVFFDLGGTLLDFRDPEGWSRIAREGGLEVEPEAIAHAVAFVERRTDGPRRPEFVDFWREVLREAARVEVPRRFAEQFLQRYYAEPRDGELYSDVVRCLEELARERRRLGVISNSRSEASVRQHLAAAGILERFTVVVSSGSEGVEKPDRAIFDRAAARLGVGNAEAFHVGDLAYTDAKGAALAGLGSVWLNRDGTGFGEDPPEITSLSELPGYIREVEGRSR